MMSVNNITCAKHCSSIGGNHASHEKAASTLLRVLALLLLLSHCACAASAASVDGWGGVAKNVTTTSRVSDPSPDQFFSDLCSLVKSALPSACSTSGSCTNIKCSYDIPAKTDFGFTVIPEIAFDASFDLDLCGSTPSVSLSVGMTHPAQVSHTFSLQSGTEYVLPGFGVDLLVAKAGLAADVSISGPNQQRTVKLGLDFCGELIDGSELCGSDLTNDISTLQGLFPLTVLSGSLDVSPLCKSSNKYITYAIYGGAALAALLISTAVVVCWAKRHGGRVCGKQLLRATSDDSTVVYSIQDQYRAPMLIPASGVVQLKQVV